MSKVVLITGASRGIGAASAKVFAQNGYSVAVNFNKNEEEAMKVCKDIFQTGGIAFPFKADIRDRAQIDSMIEEIISKLGVIDVLINNAGIAQQKLFTDISNEDWQNMLDTNVTGMFNCTQAVLPNMISKKSGKIINVSSIWGITGASCEVHYSTAKAAIIGFTKALAKEVGLSGIQVNCVAPGVILTDMNAALDSNTINVLKEETPLGVIGKPEDIANSLFFLASEKSDFITGQILSPNGGFVI